MTLARGGPLVRAGRLRPHRLPASAGFTAVEVVVVVALLIIFGAVAVVSLQNMLPVLQAKGVSEQVASAIRQARQLAITAAVEHCIVLSGTTYEIRQGTCPGSALDGPVLLTQSGCIGADCGSTFSFTFSPGGAVDPVGPTTMTVAAAGCTVALTLTAAGGVTLGPPPC